MRRQFGGRRQTRLWREGSKGKVDGPPGRGLWSPVGDGLCSHRGRRLKKKPAPVPVISTVAGQPPIGKPLIVQARGQLRLTWISYAGPPQSGEISLLYVTCRKWEICFQALCQSASLTSLMSDRLSPSNLKSLSSNLLFSSSQRDPWYTPYPSTSSSTSS